MITARQWAVAAARLVASEPIAAAEGLELAEFQSDAARRLAGIVRRWGGALLADGVGLGKTRVALTVAAALAREQRIAGARGVVWLCVPSRLADAWRAGARQAGLQATIVTHAAMSRGRLPEVEPLVIVVDEAHRFRNPRTARRRALADQPPVPLLLVTATPVANSLDDLWSLLELFLHDDDVREQFGWDLATARDLAASGAWDATELLREVTVRRTEAPMTTGFGRRPRVELEIARYQPSTDEAWLWANLEPAVRELSFARQAEDWPLGLFVEHVLRRWESGADALRETLGELLAYALRRVDAARRGRALDRRDFRAIFGEQPAQEVFAFVYPPHAGDGPSVAQLEADVARLAEVAERVERVCGSSRGRDAVLVELAQRGEPLLVFTSFQAAARGLFRRLAADLGPRARVGLVTGTAAEVTGLGRVPAAEVLRRFAPASHGVALPEHQRVEVLVATDCISEGVNLQDCGTIVMADLPYSPLAVEQRIGRLVRPGGPHEVVRVVLCRPTDWNDSLGLRRRLSEKLAVASNVGFAAKFSPFAALTALERIASQHEPDTALPRAARLVEHPTSWLVLARVNARVHLAVVGAKHPAAAQIVELAWDETACEPCDVPVAVEQYLAEHQRFLRAAWAAPAALDLDSPEIAAWRVIAGIRPDLRDRLIRRQRPGTRRHLARLTHARPVERLVRFVEALPAPHAEPTLQLVAALGLG